jgi:hypothetical protein
MGDKGQASDPLRPDFNPTAFRTIPGYIEIVEPGDSLAGPGGANVGKLKLRAWRSHEVLDSALDESAGVGWRLAERWWPYMRATFVTPPFAGYVSGHSTFSRAAAEVLTLFTGDEYFPGGMGEFHAAQNEFLRVEEGPSVDVTLQWARYRDASDQCSLSRIWTGIHPPVDDIAGRKMGAIVGAGAFARAEQFFSGTVSSVAEAGERGAGPGVYPNPAPSGMPVNIEVASGERTVGIDVYNVLGQELRRLVLDLPGQSGAIGSAASVTPVTIPTTGLIPGVYFIRIRQAPSDRFVRLLLIR